MRSLFIVYTYNIVYTYYSSICAARVVSSGVSAFAGCGVNMVCAGDLPAREFVCALRPPPDQGPRPLLL